MKTMSFFQLNAPTPVLLSSCRVQIHCFVRCEDHIHLYDYTTLNNMGQRALNLSNKNGKSAIKYHINSCVKGALNPNFLNLTKNREKFCL